MGMDSDRLRELLNGRALSRRTALKGAIGLGLAGLLAACSNEDDDDDSAPVDEANDDEEPAATDDEVDDSDGDVRTVQHALGESEIPVSPQRVIALDPYITLPTALLVDAPVIGTCYLPFGEPFPVFVDAGQADGIEDVGWFTEMDLEKVVALQPDLIVGRLSFVEDAYSQLSEIAPTVAIATDDDVRALNWKSVVREVASVLGRADEVEQAIGEHEARVEQLRTAIGPELDTMEVSIANFRAQDDIRVYTADSCAGQTLEEIGFARPEGHARVDGSINIGLSIERLNEIDADILFYFVGSAATEPEEARQQSEMIQSHPLWEQLEVVQRGQVFEIDQRWWFTCGSVQAADRIVDDLFELLVGEDVSDKDSEAFPVTIEHKFGSTTIEEAPIRVVSVGLVEQDALLALGVVPVATREWYGELPGAIFPWAEDLLDGVDYPEVLDFELDFERIAALEPDVIIGLYSGLEEAEYEILSRIAPTVAQPAEYVDWGIPWNSLTLSVGKIIGKEQEAIDLVDLVEDRFAEVRENHPEFAGQTAVVATPWGLPENYYVYGSQDTRGRFLTWLGLEVPEVFDELAGEQFGATISVEQINLLGDLAALIWISDASALDEVALYQTLPVVQEGRVLYYPPDHPVYDALNFGTVLSLQFSIDEIVPELAELFDREGA